MASRVEEVTSFEEFNAKIRGSPLVVLDCFATWCGPCKRVAPDFDQMSIEYPKVKFLKADIDKVPDVASFVGANSVPLFVFYLRGQRVNAVSGAKPAEIRKLLDQYAASADVEDESYAPGQMSLISFVENKQVACLNRNEQEGSVAEIFQGKPSKVLESDCDEQLLLIIPFTQRVRLHSLLINAPDDGRAPATVKLYINEPNMDFTSVEDTDAVQELTFTEPSQTLELDYVNFQNVNCLTIFVENNQGGEPTTALSRLVLIGSTASHTDMSRFGGSSAGNSSTKESKQQ